LHWFHQELLRAFREVDDRSIDEPGERTVWRHLRAHPRDGLLRYGTYRARLNGPNGLWPGKKWSEIRDVLENEALPET
jgi:hypothetical protein